MNRALKRIGSSEKKYVVVATRSGKVKMDISGICYVEVLEYDGSVMTELNQNWFEVKILIPIPE